ncbi:MAG: 2-phospho-L-lactate guanylyltransferase [Caldilineaceae bacterium SB0661_bin_32]|uniref:Phosphoenolpyruvate guanylyltransferase n=1 Tax=Caldilineaceae bacterium SB0661_bin_32 TaxID=2605255 RepID=A0A6B1D292_9CHLR|nr:2-phospho-L-lactate guanylyltransferase [Caldilineaceae bacterium SB0661_bin_32]
MTLWTIVPVKPFNEGKSRLAGHISPQQRCALNRELLTRTLAAINRARLDAELLVVSRDTRALAAAERAGSRALAEESQPCTAPSSSCSPNDAESEQQLNAALTQAARYAATHGATRVLVLPTDMPNLTAGDVRAMASTRGPEPQITIAPSRDGGTNALMLQPAQAIPFAFGRGSFLRHQRLAAEAGIPVHVVKSDSLLFDIDQPEDYRLVFDFPG